PAAGTDQTCPSPTAEAPQVDPDSGNMCHPSGGKEETMTNSHRGELFLAFATLRRLRLARVALLLAPILVMTTAVARVSATKPQHPPPPSTGSSFATAYSVRTVTRWPRASAKRAAVASLWAHYAVQRLLRLQTATDPQQSWGSTQPETYNHRRSTAMESDHKAPR